MLHGTEPLEMFFPKNVAFTGQSYISHLWFVEVLTIDKALAQFNRGRGESSAVARHATEKAGDNATDGQMSWLAQLTRESAADLQNRVDTDRKSLMGVPVPRAEEKGAWDVKCEITVDEHIAARCKNGMLWLDHILAEVIEETGGNYANATAENIRARARARWSEFERKRKITDAPSSAGNEKVRRVVLTDSGYGPDYRESPLSRDTLSPRDLLQLHRRWHPYDDDLNFVEELAPMRALVEIAQCHWHDTVKLARPPSAKNYALISKHAGATSHMAGAAPHEIKPDEYGLVPQPQGYAAHSSRSLILLDGHQLKKAHQAVLPIAHPRDNETLPESLMGREVGLSVVGYKIALAIMSSPHALGGGEIVFTAKEWAQLVYASARYRVRHLVSVVESFFLLPRPFIYLPGPNPGWAGMFDTFVGTDNPGAITHESVLAASLRRRFCEHVNAAMRGRGDTWCGSFMLNLGAAMRLPNDQPEPLRLHVAAARYANAARYRVGHLRYESIDMIAARVNAFAPGVAEKLKANKKLTRSSGSAAAQRTRARKRIKDAFELFAGERVWVVDKRGKSDEYRLLPTKRDRDARSDFRRRGPNPI